MKFKQKAQLVAGLCGLGAPIGFVSVCALLYDRVPGPLLYLLASPAFLIPLLVAFHFCRCPSCHKLTSVGRKADFCCRCGFRFEGESVDGQEGRTQQ